MRHHTSMTFNVDQQCCASGATTRAVKTRDFFIYIMKFKFGLWEMLRHHIIKQSCLSPLFTCILPSQSHHAKGGTTRSTTITTSHHIITSESQVYSLPLGRMNIMNSGRGWMEAVGAWVVSRLEPLVFFFFLHFFLLYLLPFFILQVWLPLPWPWQAKLNEGQQRGHMTPRTCQRQPGHHTVSPHHPTLTWITTTTITPGAGARAATAVAGVAGVGAAGAGLCRRAWDTSFSSPQYVFSVSLTFLFTADDYFYIHLVWCLHVWRRRPDFGSHSQMGSPPTTITPETSSWVMGKFFFFLFHFF